MIFKLKILFQFINGNFKHILDFKFKKTEIRLTLTYIFPTIKKSIISLPDFDMDSIVNII